MPIQVAKLPLPGWADGDDALYNDYVMTIARGGVHHFSKYCFYFRYNICKEIEQWLLEDCSHNGVLEVNKTGYLAKVTFDTLQGVMEFKLRWM